MGAFDETSGTDEVLSGVDLNGKRVLVTGTSAGLGVETARALTARGAEVFGVVRDPYKARRALDQAGAVAVTLYEADLASLASIRAFTDRFVSDGQGPLDVVVANAGIMACPEGRTEDGFEVQFGTNHLGHFVLVNRLLPLLTEGTAARVIVLSSGGHRIAGVDLDDPNFERSPYEPWTAYGRSKTANILFAVELDRRLQARGLRASAVHPGMIVTELGRHLTRETMGVITKARDQPSTRYKSVAQGAATSVWAGFVAEADDIGGRYCEDCAVSPVLAEATPGPGVMAYAVDPAIAGELWRLSEELVGETFAP